MPNPLPKLDFYIVTNEKGEFLRKIGYGGSGGAWTEDILKARVFTNIKGARTRVGYFVNHYQGYPTPKILHYIAEAVEIIDETARIAATKQRKATKDAKRAARDAKSNLESAQRDLQEAKQNLEEARRQAWRKA